MKENLLHFIWKLRLFSYNRLLTTDGKRIEIESCGIENLNSGPDFSNARIEIDAQLWAGNVEIHLNSSDWYVHHHEKDERYDSVILHVVWNHDIEVFRSSNDVIATLELKNYISKSVLDNYKDLFDKRKNWINCENDINKVDKFVIDHWLERLYFERLEQKSKLIQYLLKISNNNWESSLFESLAKNFGLKVNREAFANFASSFDHSILRKIAGNPVQIEALFFGQSGLLNPSFESEYFHKLKEEYQFLQLKYDLKPISSQQVQFFRLRPNNFPTIRLSQLASLYVKHHNLFSKLLVADDMQAYYELFEVSTSVYWENHYTFEKESNQRIKKLSKSFIDLLVINTVIPIKFWYLRSIGKQDFGSLIKIMEEISPEKNTIISRFKALNIDSNHALTTQALLQLKNEYCNQQRCLNCAIGKALIQG